MSVPADLPSPTDLTRLLHRWLPAEDLRHRVLVTNPAALYDF